MHWVLPSRVLDFSFSLLLYLQLEVVHKVLLVVLEVLEVKVEVLMMVTIGLLSQEADVVSVMLYLIHLRQRPLMLLL